MSDEKEQAAAKRAAWIAALEEEKRGYEVRGLTDRASQVDEQIKAAQSKPRGRKAPTTD